MKITRNRRYDAAAILADVRAGLVYTEIAARHNVSRSLVGSLAINHGLSRNEVDRDTEGLPRGEWVLHPRRRIRVWVAAS